MKRFKNYISESEELDEGIKGAAIGGAGGAAAGYAKGSKMFGKIGGTIGGIAGGIVGAAGGSGVEDGYKSTRKKKKMDEVSSEKLADYANKAINDKDKAKRDAQRAKDSAAANRFRGDNKAAERDDARGANATDRVRRRNRGGSLATRKMLTKKEDNQE